MGSKVCSLYVTRFVLAAVARVIVVWPGSLTLAWRVCFSIPAVATVELSMPNIHYIPFKHLSNLGLSFNDDIYLPTSEPAGAIRATVRQRVLLVCSVHRPHTNCVARVVVWCGVVGDAQVGKPGQKLRSKL